MAYFLATPHRWMTILLVVCDPDRRGGRTGRFAAIGVLTAALVAGVYVATGSFQLLALAYAILVGWHFASQHAGILRMYARKAGGGRRWLETWPPRFSCSTPHCGCCRASTRSTRYADLELSTVDWLMLAIPAAMLAIELADRPWKRVAQAPVPGEFHDALRVDHPGGSFSARRPLSCAVGGGDHRPLGRVPRGGDVLRLAAPVAGFRRAVSRHGPKLDDRLRLVRSSRAGCFTALPTTRLRRSWRSGSGSISPRRSCTARMTA